MGEESCGYLALLLQSVGDGGWDNEANDQASDRKGEEAASSTGQEKASFAAVGASSLK